MATWDDVRQAALALPLATEQSSRGDLAWQVRDKTFAWERPLRKNEIAALGDTAPDGPVLGLRVQDLDAKEEVLAENPGVCFTTPHFAGYPAVLVRLDAIDPDALGELVTDAWVARAPKRAVKDFLAEHPAAEA